MEIRFTLQAIADLDEIHERIAKHANRETATRFIDRFRRSLDILSVFPYSGSARDDLPEGLRVFVYRNHLVIYRVEDEAIIVEGVVHSSRDRRDLFEP